MNEVKPVATLRTEAIIAKEIRDKLTPLLEQIREVLDEAKAQGILVSYSFAQDQFGRTKLNEITLVKNL